MNEKLLKDPTEYKARNFRNHPTWKLHHGAMVVNGAVMSGATTDGTFFTVGGAGNPFLDDKLMCNVPVHRLFTVRLGELLVNALNAHLRQEGQPGMGDWQELQEKDLPGYMHTVYKAMQSLKKTLPQVLPMIKDRDRRISEMSEHRLVNFYDRSNFEEHINNKTLTELNGGNTDFENNDTWKFNLVLWAKGNKKKDLCKLLNYNHKKFLKREAELENQNNNNNNQNLNDTVANPVPSNPTPPLGNNQPNPQSGSVGGGEH